jgi:hypothetical protein
MVGTVVDMVAARLEKRKTNPLSEAPSLNYMHLLLWGVFQGETCGLYRLRTLVDRRHRGGRIYDDHALKNFYFLWLHLAFWRIHSTERRSVYLERQLQRYDAAPSTARKRNGHL